jgi:hypothetical protein
VRHTIAVGAVMGKVAVSVCLCAVVCVWWLKDLRVQGLTRLWRLSLVVSRLRLFPPLMAMAGEQDRSSHEPSVVLAYPECRSVYEFQK